MTFTIYVPLCIHMSLFNWFLIFPRFTEYIFNTPTKKLEAQPDITALDISLISLTEICWLKFCQNINITNHRIQNNHIAKLLHDISDVTYSFVFYFLSSYIYEREYRFHFRFMKRDLVSILVITHIGIISFKSGISKRIYIANTAPSVSVVSTLIPVVFRIRNGMLFTKNFALVYAKNYAAQPGLNEIPPAKKVSNEIFKYILI